MIRNKENNQFRYYQAEENIQIDDDESKWNSKSCQLTIDCAGASKGLQSPCRPNFLHGFATVSCPLLHIHSTTPIPPFGTLLGRCGSLRPTSCLTLRHGYRGPQVIFCYPYILLNGINKYLNSFISIRARHLHFHANHTED